MLSTALSLARFLSPFSRSPTKTLSEETLPLLYPLWELRKHLLRKTSPSHCFSPLGWVYCPVFTTTIFPLHCFSTLYFFTFLSPSNLYSTILPLPSLFKQNPPIGYLKPPVPAVEATIHKEGDNVPGNQHQKGNWLTYLKNHIFQLILILMWPDGTSDTKLYVVNRPLQTWHLLSM